MKKQWASNPGTRSYSMLRYLVGIGGVWHGNARQLAKAVDSNAIDATVQVINKGRQQGYLVATGENRIVTEIRVTAAGYELARGPVEKPKPAPKKQVEERPSINIDFAALGPITRRAFDPDRLRAAASNAAGMDVIVDGLR